MVNLIMKTKLNKPQLPATFIERSYGFEAMQDARLLLLSAHAGAGKSTAVSYWLEHQPLPYCWYSLDEWDNDILVFLSYLGEGITRVDEKVGRQLLDLLDGSYGMSGEALTKTVISLLHQGEQPYVIVLDDYHWITEQGIHDFVEKLLLHMPTHLKLCLMTREDPPFSLARLRSLHQVMELRRKDLKFTQEEGWTFFQNVLANQINPEQFQYLYERSEGWIAGLQLMSLSINALDHVDQFVEDIASSSNYMMDYLLEEVFKRQSKEMQRFLLQTSVLNFLTPELIAYVMRGTISEADNGLKALELSNCFLISLDLTKPVYRYHHLFRELLKQRFKRIDLEQYQETLRLAGKWFEERDEHLEAINLYLEGHWFDEAAALIEKLWEPMDFALRSSSWLDLAKRLPLASIDASAVLCLGYGWALLNRGDIDKCDGWFQKAEAIYKASDADEVLEIVPINLLSAKAYKSAVMGQFDLMMEHIEQLNGLTEGRPFKRQWLIESYVGMMHWGKGDLVKALERMQRVRGGKLGHLNPATASSFTWVVAEILIEIGELTKAKVMLEEAVEQTVGSHTPVMLATYYLLLAVIECLRGQRDAAYALLEKSRGFGYRYEYLDWRYRYYLILSRLFMQDHLLEKAADTLREGSVYTYVNPKPESMTFAYMKMWVDIQRDSGHYKSTFYLEEGFRALDQTGKTLPDYRDEMYWRIVLFEGPLDLYGAKMAQLCKGLLERARAQERSVQVVEYLLLSSRFAPNGPRRRELIDEAVVLSQKEGIIQPFIEFERLLVDSSVVVPKSSQDRVSVAARRESANQSLSEPLTVRELELLDLIAKGYSNQEICDVLFIAMSTVKSYNNNLFGKLEVKRRTEAVAKARTVGLID